MRRENDHRRRENELSRRGDSGGTLPSCKSSNTSVLKVNICKNIVVYVFLNDIMFEGIGSAANHLGNKKL